MAHLPVYLADFSCFNAPDELKVDFFKSQEAAWKWKCCTKAKHDFVSKIFLASGISTTQTAVPACIQPVHCDEPKMDLHNAQAECKLVYGQVISEVLRKTGLKATDVDILLTNTSIYCPTPSIASLVVNMFGMREDVQCYHMGGMGCAMGVVGLNLVKDMLVAHPGKICLFVSSEIITSAFYPGQRQEALLTNALFRMGGSAAILTNNPAWKARSKYQLQHCLRVHTGASDRAFNTLNWEPDENGINGMVITKTLPSEAAAVLEKEADLPRPISNDYKSIFDLPSTRSQEEQKKVIESTNAAPRVTLAQAKLQQEQREKAAAASAAAECIKLHAAAAVAAR
ncbi:hypothetical protein OEZ86_003885 [Tetradesmus obliquus]|nr:hypothetical protein OEZ86_003885 [Tetradesmus obliquus]